MAGGQVAAVTETVVGLRVPDHLKVDSEAGSRVSIAMLGLLAIFLRQMIT